MLDLPEVTTLVLKTCLALEAQGVTTAIKGVEKKQTGNAKNMVGISKKEYTYQVTVATAM